MEQNNLHDKIQQLLGDLKGNFNILEEQIDINVQLEYFETSKDIKTNLDKEDTLRKKEDLLSEAISIDEKKKLLTKLASIDKVEAYRILEKYKQNPDPQLKEWASLALQESKMLMESSLLEESQVFISTGLGGKGQKLRYFIVVIAKEGLMIDDTRKKIIKSESDFTFKKYDAEIESFNFFESFATIKAVVPFSVQLQEMLEESIESCNQFGDFMQLNFIVTNVKELSHDEIVEVLKTSEFPGQEQQN